MSNLKIYVRKWFGEFSYNTRLGKMVVSQWQWVWKEVHYRN